MVNCGSLIQSPRGFTNPESANRSAQLLCCMWRSYRRLGQENFRGFEWVKIKRVLGRQEHLLKILLADGHV